MPRTQRQRAAERKRRDREDYDACMEREDWTCQVCGRRDTQAMQMHHGKRKHDPRIRHDRRYHYATCNHCHDRAHRNVAWWNEWMKNNPNNEVEQ